MASAVISDPRIGTELAGYRIEETLGRGGMGIVYLARDPWLDRRVALKLITPELAARASFRERFLRESQLAAPLEHAHVIPIYEAGEVDGVLYLAMRYVPGTDLGGLLDAGPLEPTRALAILEQVAIALDAAHAKGLVHRDVKPGNILLAQDEDADQISAVYLSDFGLTKHETDEVQLTAAEDVIGTLAYAAPEQIEGDEVGPAVDVYSLGCVLYECLVGDVPFPTESKMELLWAHLEEAPPRLSERSPQFPSSLDGVLARALAKSPGERFERCGEFVAAAWLALAGDGEASKLARRTRAAVPRRDVRNPYKGLRAFSEEDADDFFGREALTEEIADRLAAGERFLAIVGPSGSGKSSVVRAGLLPLLRAGTIPGSGRWPIVEFRPGARPVEELEAALGRVPGTGAVLPHLGTDPSALCREARKLVADSGASLLVVIDQFEELFTMTDDERRGQFLALLERAVTDPDSPVRVVVTLRADFYDRPLRVRGLSELVEAGHVAVHPLSPGELESAITSPAVGAGVELEQALVAEIVADVVDQPGALPLLQHALGELFERRDGRTLTEESYREIRGVGGALAARAAS